MEDPNADRIEVDEEDAELFLTYVPNILFVAQTTLIHAPYAMIFGANAF